MTSKWAEARRTIDENGTSRLRTGVEQRAFVRHLRNEPTAAEAALWARLRRKQIGFKFARQRTILQYVADFYCPSTGLVVEVDGGYHGSTQELVAYEQRRDRDLLSLGLTMLRFTNEQVLGDINAVLSEIATHNARLGVHRPLIRRFLLVNGARDSSTPPKGA